MTCRCADFRQDGADKAHGATAPPSPGEKGGREGSGAPGAGRSRQCPHASSFLLPVPPGHSAFAVGRLPFGSGTQKRHPCTPPPPVGCSHRTPTREGPMHLNAFAFSHLSMAAHSIMATLSFQTLFFREAESKHRDSDHGPPVRFTLICTDTDLQ